MSTEAYPVFNGEINKTDIETFLAVHTPVDTDAYIAEKVADIAAGNPTWIVRNLDSDARVYDYIVQGRLFGFIDQEGPYAEVYVIEEDEQPALDISFETESMRDNMTAAIDYLEGLAHTYAIN